MSLEQKNPFSEARKARRKIINERNAQGTAKLDAAKKRDSVKDQLIDLSKKDNKSGRGRYI